MEKRGLAFYKKSEKPWTQEDLQKIYKYVGCVDNTPIDGFEMNKYVYDDWDDRINCAYFPWVEQNEFDDCKILCFEEVFEGLRKRRKR